MLFLMVEVSPAALNGKITVGDSSATHDPFHTLVLSTAGEEAGVSVTAQEGNTDFVLVWIIRLCGGISCTDARLVDRGRAARTRGRAIRSFRDDHKG